MKVLVDKGADVQAKDKGTGDSALHIAISEKHDSVIRYLLGKGANVYERNNSGERAYDVAVKHLKTGIVDIGKNLYS